MATKKKVKAGAASKAKKAPAKKSVKAKGVKKAAGNTKKKVAAKKVAAKKAAPVKKKTVAKKAIAKQAKTKTRTKAKTSNKRPAQKEEAPEPQTPVITHGEDMHLIPVHGEIHPARRDEAQLLEKQFRHNQETAFQREQQHARQILAHTNKRVFKNPRQS